MSNRFDIATEHDTRLINNFSRVHADWRTRYFRVDELEKNERAKKERKRGKGGGEGKKKRGRGRERNEKKGMLETKSKVQGNNLGMYRYVRMYASLDQYRTRHSGCGRLKLDYREKKKGGENGEYSVSRDTPASRCQMGKD